jgi:RHS repeat-associated protein
MPQSWRATTYSYDAADRLTSVTDPASNITQYTYDTENNLLSITDANNHTTQFAYNARGWVTQTTFPSTLAESYAYDLVGNLLSKTDRKGNTIQYVYDALNRMTQKTYPNSTTVEYVYDLANKVLQVADPTGTYGFAYDNMGRLISTTTNYTSLFGTTYTNGYTYDAASNRTALTAPDGSTSTYHYDTLNRLNTLANSWAGSFGFGYDALSRRTQLTRPNGVNTNYGYDSLSHLLSVLHQAGATTLDGASYTYDPAGNRTAKTNDLSGVTSSYTYDPLYELTQVTQGGGTTESYSYDAVGNRLTNPFQYTGRDYDPETGLRFYRARYYDPSVGRFLNEDPAGFGGGINVYAYVKNDPADFTDPTGLKCWQSSPWTEIPNVWGPNGPTPYLTMQDGLNWVRVGWSYASWGLISDSTHCICRWIADHTRIRKFYRYTVQEQAQFTCDCPPSTEVVTREVTKDYEVDGPGNPSWPTEYEFTQGPTYQAGENTGSNPRNKKNVGCACSVPQP